MPDSDERLVVLLEARIRDFEKNMQKASGTADRSYDRMRRNSRSATRAMETDMVRSTHRINQALAASSAKIGAYGKSFAIGISAGVVAALGPLELLKKAIQGIGDTADMKRLADMIGISTTSLQALEYAAVQAGVNIDQMKDGLSDFAGKVAEAASGAGPLAAIFKANNIELKKQDGTLRSTRDVLADFADLIKNARTPAEQLYLAQQAFGDEAARMVPIFKDGARGIEQLEVNAKAAGAVIDEELVTRAEELDKRMSSMWATFAAESKSALLTAIEGMDNLLDRYDEFEKRRNAAQLGAMAGAAVGQKGDVATGAGKEDRATGLDKRMGGKPYEPTPEEKEIIAALEKRYGTAKPTVIPETGSGGSRSTSASKIDRQAEATKRLIAELQEELRLVGATNTERDISNALRRAGVAATSKEGQQIAQLVTQINAETEALEKSKEAQEARTQAISNLFEMGGDALADIVSGSMDAEEAVKRLAVQLAIAAAQAALLGTGPLAGLFSGGGIGSIFTSPNVSSETTGSITKAISSGVTHGMEAYRSAIKLVESAGNGGYSAMGPMLDDGDQALGAYQVMKSNLPSWTKEALGKSMTPAAFLASPRAQDSVFDHFFGKSLSKYGNPQDAASVWFTGRPMSAAANTATDILGTSGSQYVDKFNDALDKVTGGLGKFGEVAGKAVPGVGMLGRAGDQASRGLETFASNLSRFPAAPSGGGGGLLGSLFGGGASIASMMAISPAATADILSGSWGMFANGTENAPPGWAWVGEKGPELMKMRGGETIRSNARSMAMVNQSKPPIVNFGVNVINNAGAEVRTEERRENDGSMSIDVIVDRMAAKNLTTRGTATNNALRGGFGARQVLKRG